MSKKPQIDKFREAAREIGADEDETRFDKSLGDIARHKPASSEDGERERKPKPAKAGR